MKITRKFLEENIFCDEIQRNKSQDPNKSLFTFRRSFFYTHGKDEDDFAFSIDTQLSKLMNNSSYVIIEKGEKFVPFRGGDSVRKGSHWYCKIQFNKNIKLFEES